MAVSGIQREKGSESMSIEEVKVYDNDYEVSCDADGCSLTTRQPGLHKTAVEKQLQAKGWGLRFRHHADGSMDCVGHFCPEHAPMA